MPSLSLMHWLLVGNIALLLLVGGLLWSLRSKQLREAQRLDHALAAMQQAQSGLSKSTVGMGRRLKQLEGRLQQTERRSVLPDTDDDTFAQASRLIGLGATANDLVDNCGVPRGEAELMVSLKRQSLPH